MANSGKWGLIDTTGKLLAPFQYDKIDVFNKGKAAVFKAGKRGFIDRTGKEIVQPQYDEEIGSYPVPTYFNEGLAVVQKGGRVIFVDSTGKEFLKTSYIDARNFEEGMAVVYKGYTTAGFIDPKGKEVVKPQYNYAASFREGLAAVSKNGMGGYIDKSGKIVIALQFGVVGDFYNGIAVVGKNGKKGMVDRNGKYVVNPVYDSVWHFSDDMALVQSDSRFGYVDRNGKEIVKPKYDRALDFHEGVAVVSQNEKYGLIDKTGKVVVGLEYDYIGDSVNGMALVQKGRKYGYIHNPLDKPESWAASEVEEAIASNMVPPAMQHHYADNITRADFSRLVMHAITVKTGRIVEELLAEEGKQINASVFRDISDPTILAAYSLGIISGKGDGLFDPEGHITRQEAAVLLARTADLLGMRHGNFEGMAFADQGDIDGWASDSVAFVSSAVDQTSGAKIMGSTGNDKFSPKASYTRQQAFITVKRLMRSQ